MRNGNCNSSPCSAFVQFSPAAAATCPGNVTYHDNVYDGRAFRLEHCDGANGESDNGRRQGRLQFYPGVARAESSILDQPVWCDLSLCATVGAPATAKCSRMKQRASRCSGDRPGDLLHVRSDGGRAVLCWFKQRRNLDRTFCAAGQCRSGEGLLAQATTCR